MLVLISVCSGDAGTGRQAMKAGSTEGGGSYACNGCCLQTQFNFCDG